MWSPLCEQEDSSEPDSPVGYCGRVRIPISSVAAACGEFCCLILSTLLAESHCWEIVTPTLNELIRQSGVHVPPCQRVETQFGFQNRYTTLCVNGYVTIFAFLYACLSNGWNISGEKLSSPHEWGKLCVHQWCLKKFWYSWMGFGQLPSVYLLCQQVLKFSPLVALEGNDFAN